MTELDQAMQLHHAGRLHDAEKIYRKILAANPNHPDALHNLGVVALQVGQHQAAVDLFHRAVAQAPTRHEYHNSLGLALTDLARYEEAINAFKQAIAHHPNYAEAYSNMGNAFYRLGRTSQAVAAQGKAVSIRPDMPEAQNNLGSALQMEGRNLEAVAAHRRAIELNPNYGEAYNNMGNALLALDRIDEAAEAFRQAIVLLPNLSEAHANLATAQLRQSDLSAALLTLEKTLKLAPQNAAMHCNLIFTLLHHAGTEKEVARQNRLWNERHAAQMRPHIRPHPNDRDPDRKLRVGYVSPDFRDHPVASGIENLLATHDPNQVDVFCYVDVAKSDALTERLRKLVPNWRETTGMRHVAVAEQIRNDRIDILVDLCVHTAGNRLLVFAAKPAPVQVTYLGYCGTTGLPTVDYRFSDQYLDPPDSDLTAYSEETWRLPHTYWCYSPSGPTPETQPPPAIEAGRITFGCMNNFTKVSPQTQQMWAKVLAAVPNSQMLIHSYPGQHRQIALNRLAETGISPERIQFIPREPWPGYVRNIQRIDIALDTWPYAGGITTCDALYMGVPVVTLSGQTPVSRGGRSILSTIGLPELAAETPDEYVRLATELAGDLPRLTELRQNLRARMQSSPLMNAKQFARDVEAAYREMWSKWCRTGKP